MIKKENAKLPYLKTVATIDVPALSEEGEIYTAKKKTQIVIQEDKSFMLMFNYLFGLINGLHSVVDIKVMTWITENLNYNNNMITLNKFWIEEIKKSTDFSVSAIKRAIGILVEKKYLIKEDSSKRTAMYHVNPTYVWYGDTDKREHVLKWTLEIQQNDTLPDKEKKTLADIKRFAEQYKKNG